MLLDRSFYASLQTLVTPIHVFCMFKTLSETSFSYKVFTILKIKPKCKLIKYLLKWTSQQRWKCNTYSMNKQTTFQESMTQHPKYCTPMKHVFGMFNNSVLYKYSVLGIYHYFYMYQMLIIYTDKCIYAAIDLQLNLKNEPVTTLRQGNLAKSTLFC